MSRWTSLVLAAAFVIRAVPAAAQPTTPATTPAATPAATPATPSDTAAPKAQSTAPAAPSAKPAADKCTPVMDALAKEFEVECTVLNAKMSERLKLRGENDPEKNKEAIAQLEAEIKKIKDSSALITKGLCFATTHTCDVFATIVTSGADLASVSELSAETRAATLPVDTALGRDAAEPERQTANNKSGTSAQVDPVEAIQPITLAGGAVALSGTRSGTKGVGVITINPLALAAPSDVAMGRTLDLSVSAPFDLDQGTSEDRRYVSARLRANFTALYNTSELQEAVDAWMKEAGRQADQVQEILLEAKDVRACAEHIARTNNVSAKVCEVDLDNTALKTARAKAYATIDAARRAADKHYFGLDVRFDTGDPTGPDVVGDKGAHLLGGFAAGVHLTQSKRWDWELRGRAAGDYFASRDDGNGPRPKPVYSFDWGAAFILQGRLENRDKQRLAVGFGVEGRQAGKDMDDARQTPTNFANLNLMTIVPAASGGDLGLAISIPIAEAGVKRGAIVSLSTDLGLLDHSAN